MSQSLGASPGLHQGLSLSQATQFSSRTPHLQGQSSAMTSAPVLAGNDTVSLRLAQLQSRTPNLKFAGNGNGNGRGNGNGNGNGDFVLGGVGEGILGVVGAICGCCCLLPLLAIGAIAMTFARRGK